MTPRADAFVFFGATGDLARKMIFPALYRLVKTRRLDVPVIGVAFSGWDAAQLAKRVTESVAEHGGLDDRDALERLLSLVRYVDGDYNNTKTFDALRTALGPARTPVHYLAIPPKLFATVVGRLGESDCARDGRVVVEKPFGHDLASARELNRILRTVFPDETIYRIDHFLGETAVLNILYLYCHTEKIPKKETFKPTDLNERGKWLYAEKEKRKAPKSDAAWLKEYPGGPAQK